MFPHSGLGIDPAYALWLEATHLLQSTRLERAEKIALSWRKTHPWGV